MRALLVSGCCVLLAGCFDFGALKADYGKDLASGGEGDLGSIDQSVGDQAGLDFAVELDMAMAIDQAVSDQSALGDQSAMLDLRAVADLRPPPSGDLAGACGFVPSGDVVLYVRASAPPSNLDCTKALPCQTLTKAKAKIASATLSATILVEEGTYNETVAFNGPVTLLGGMYADFDCRGSDSHQTRLHGVTVGEPTLRGTANANGQLTIDGFDVFGPDTAAITTPLRTVWFSGIGEATIRGSRIVSHDSAGTMAQRIEVVRSDSSTLVIDRSAVEIPDGQPAAATQKNAVYLCGSNATLKDVRIFVDLSGATNSAVVESQDDTGGCAGGGPNELFVIRSLISGAGGMGSLAVRTNWIRLPSDEKLVSLERSVLRVAGGTGASVGFYSQTPLTLHVYGSTISVGQAGMAYAISLFANTSSPNPSLVLKDSILSAATYAVLFTTAPSGDGSAFERNIFQVGGPVPGPNPVVISNAGTNVTKMMMENDATWGGSDAKFGDPKLALDGFHLTAQSSVAINQALTCWGTADINADFEGTPVLTSGNPFCDIGADEFQ